MFIIFNQNKIYVYFILRKRKSSLTNYDNYEYNIIEWKSGIKINISRVEINNFNSIILTLIKSYKKQIQALIK